MRRNVLACAAVAVAGMGALLLCPAFAKADDAAPAPLVAPPNSVGTYAAKSWEPVYADAWPAESPPLIDDLHFSVIGTYLYGSARGNLQTPAGGRKGTTSSNRPHFKEIGIDDASIGDVEVRASWDPTNEIFVGAQFIRLSGDGRPGKALVSQGMFFPAKKFVSSDVKMDWYRIGYRYTFVLDQTEGGVPILTLAPLADVVIWDFNYELTGSTRHVSRSYAKPGVQIGVELTWRPEGSNFWIDAGAATFPNVHSLAIISTEHITAHYRFLRRPRYEVAASLGIAGEQQEFRDSQKPDSNHQSAVFGPMLQVGLEAKF
jgi:hypothetical protein